MKEEARQILCTALAEPDALAAPLYAQIAATRRRACRPMSQCDAQIAAIASSCSLRLATSNVTDIEGCGVQVIDPWSAAA